MKLTFWGAAEQVTGSMHLLELDHFKLLIDCGIDYELGKDISANNFFPFDPAEIDVVILTHAHIDHSGNLPTLIKEGFEGQILCTSPTADLSELLMLDSVNIFQRKADKSNKHNRKSKKAATPLYFQKHVMDTTERFVTLSFHKPFRINGDIELTFIPVGHLLGAAAAVLKITEHGIEKTIAFSGDIGRQNYPILNDPEKLPEVDYLVCEATYGGRFHTKDKTAEEVLIETIKQCCVEENGRLIIPAFSVGRTQALVFLLNKIFSKGLLPKIKVFVDSPMAILATEVYRKYQYLLNPESQEFYKNNGDKFEFENLEYVETLKDSKQISNYWEPCIIVSSAGMLEGGRIQDHLFYNIQNYYCTILFIGFCAPGTLGHRLLRGDPVVKLKGRELSVYASIKKTDLLSGHGDHDDLINFIANKPKKSPQKVFLVHGENATLNALKEALIAMGIKTEVAKKGLVYHLD